MDEGLTAREHFIPLRRADLVELLASDPGLASADKTRLRQLSRLLAATFHFEFHSRLEKLKDSYAPFDPDADTIQVEPHSPEQRESRAAEFFDHCVSLLERANYRRLSTDELTGALNVRSHWSVKLDVDFDVFERLEVFFRGDTQQTRTHRQWHTLFRRATVTVPVYQRLVVIFRPRAHKRLESHVDCDTIYIKIFKGIPKADLEMLLPGSRVKMTLLDQGRIFLPALSGIAMTVYKVVKGALVLAFAGIYGVLAFFGLVAGTIGYGVKSFLGYLRTKEKHQLNLTRHLYYQNLDNNAGVLFRLLDEAEEQEFREALLAYFLLWQRADTDGWSEQQLDLAAEAYLNDAIGSDVDFEADDALHKLERLRLIERTSNGRFRAVAIDVALRQLDNAWDNYFSYAAADDPETLALPQAEHLPDAIRRTDAA